jgi:hypothetical protein
MLAIICILIDRVQSSHSLKLFEQHYKFKYTRSLKMIKESNFDASETTKCVTQLV